MENIFIYSKDVQKALKNNKPIVALESTIISHGMPYPENLEMAQTVEKIIKDQGVIPATIAIIDGNVFIGLEEDQLKAFAKRKGLKKISRRDFSFVVSQKESGGTTVAATMIAAKRAGIKFFATGGIGGVHYGFNETLDISSDLEELSKTNLCVISAGPKAILDLENTLEYLETKGVPVIGYKTDVLPAFYSSTSPYPLNLTLNNEKDIAAAFNVQEKLNINTGMLVVNPIPKEYEIPYDKMKVIIDKALKHAKGNHIKGKDLTPYLLEEIKNLTKGLSLEANLKLVYNNAKLAARIAKSYMELKDGY